MPGEPAPAAGSAALDMKRLFASSFEGFDSFNAGGYRSDAMINKVTTADRLSSIRLSRKASRPSQRNRL